METLTNPRAPSDPTPGSRPRWVMLSRKVNDEDADSSVADANTTAASCTSSGQSFSVSFALAPPPATSRFYCNWIGGGVPCDGNGNPAAKDLSIIAGSDDSVLIKLVIPGVTLGYFLYETAGGSARPPPALSMLPGGYGGAADRHSPIYLDTKSTVLLRRPKGELVVAKLEAVYGGDTAELCVLRPGGAEWELKRLPVVHNGGELAPWLKMDAAVPVGSRFMCWVEHTSGLFICDMAEEEEDPKLVRYVPLPVLPPEERRRNGDRRPDIAYCRRLAAAGPDAVRFVSVAPRCCCGGAGKTDCERSRFAFNVTIWTLTLRMMEEPMTWVKDGVLDCDELWQLPNYGSLPRVPLQYPIVSSDNPDIVCFILSEKKYVEKADGTEWMLQVDTRRKELLSVIRGDTDLYMDDRVPANLHYWQ